MVYVLVWSESVLAWLAVIQTVIVSLRAGSRAWYLQKQQQQEDPRRMLGFVDGPVIQKPSSSSNLPDDDDALFLWDLTIAVRQAVKLGLRIDEYAEGYFYDVIRVAPSSQATATTTTTIPPADYQMSMVPYKDTDSGNTQEPMDNNLKEEVYEKQQQEEDDDDDKDDVEIVLQTVLHHRTTKPNLDEDDTDTALVTEYPMNTNTMVRITAYAPNTFQSLRTLYHNQQHKPSPKRQGRRQPPDTDTLFRRAMLNEPFVSYATNSKGAARTGGVFFFTRDGNYIVKTIKREEMQTLLFHMLPQYAAYLKSPSGRESLLTRFLGLYKLEWKHTTTKSRNGSKNKNSCLYVIIMNAVFPVGVSRHFSEMFDLKGSTVGRETTIEQQQSGKVIMMKDLDLMRNFQKENNDDKYSSGPLRIGSNAKSALMAQLQRDVQFLEGCSVIDYSLLVGILTPTDRNNRSAVPQNWRERFLSLLTAPFQSVMAPSLFLQSMKGFGHIPVSWPPIVPYYGSLQGGIDIGRLSRIGGERNGIPAIYFLGLIDFLQPYDYKKILEYRAKSLIYEKDTFSCVPPKIYADRFLAFIDKCVS